METLLEDVSATAYDKAVEVVTDVVRAETRTEDMRMIEDTKKWVLSPERKAPQSTREYTAKHLDSVLGQVPQDHADHRCPLAGKAPETGCSAERQGTGQGESTGFCSATAKPIAGRADTAEAICAAYRRKIRKLFSIIVRGDVY